MGDTGSDRRIGSAEQGGATPISERAGQTIDESIAKRSNAHHILGPLAHRDVDSRRDGNRIHYRIVDCCVGGVMELGLCLLAERGDA